MDIHCSVVVYHQEVSHILALQVLGAVSVHPPDVRLGRGVDDPGDVD